jgi:hypothetical protein
MYIGLHVKYLIILSDSNKTETFFYRFARNQKITNVTISFSSETDKSLHAYGQTDVTKLIVALVIVITHLNTAYCSGSAARRS